MRWWRSHRCDRAAVALADRHYSRMRPGTPQFMPSGRALVLVTLEGNAVWGSSWNVSLDGIDYSLYQCGGGAWRCSIFRNESPHLSSELIREALAATLHEWGPAPAGGLITFINAGKVRRKRDPGRCFLRAGFRCDGRTGTGLLVLRIAPDDMPAPEAALGSPVAFVVPPERPVIVARCARIGGPMSARRAR